MAFRRRSGVSGSGAALVVEAPKLLQPPQSPVPLDPALPCPPVDSDFLRNLFSNDTPRNNLSWAAFKNALLTGTFFDVKFILFSRRASTGVVHGRRVVWANSLMLCAQLDHFRLLLSGGFAESSVTLLDGRVEETSTETYEYESDSDIDEDEAVVPVSQHDASDAQSVPADNQHSSSHSEPNEEEVAEKDAAEAVKGIAKPSLEPDAIDTLSTTADSLSAKHKVCNVGHTIAMDDMAFKTWHAFIFYLQFGELCFAPLKSRRIPARDSASLERRDFSSPPPCSAKSMYRLADKYDLADLRMRASKAIVAQLTVANIMEELFSRFTSLYPAVAELEIDFLYDNRRVNGVMTSLLPWIDRVAAGELPHCGQVVKLLIIKLNNGTSGF